MAIPLFISMGFKLTVLPAYVQHFKTSFGSGGKCCQVTGVIWYPSKVLNAREV